MKYERETIGHIINELAEMQRRVKVLSRSDHYQLLSVYDGIDECIYVADPETYELLYVNKKLEKLFGNVIGKKCYKVFQDSTSPCPFCTNKHILGEKLGETYIWNFQNKINKRWYHCIDRAVQWPDGRMVRCELAIDITDRKNMEEELRKNEQEFRLTFESAKDAIFWANPDTGIIIRCNKAAEDLLEKKRHEIIGSHQISLHPPEKSKCYIKMFKKHIRQKGALDEEAEIITGTGRIKPVHITASVTSVAGRPIVQGIFRDISERKQQEEELRLLNRELVKSNRKLKRLVLKDPHTGLYNHRYFEEVIESEFYRAKRHTHPLSLIMLDIDYFKSVNEAYGHRFGDLVLKQFAKKLRKLVRLHDHVIRFGDEEFVVILPGSDSAGTLRLAQRISCATKIFDFGDLKNKVKINLSIAAVSYPEDGIYKSMDFIGLADKILDRAKECGGNRVYSSIDIKKERLSMDEGDGAGIDLLKQKLTKLTKQVNQNLIESIFAFAKTIELKDHFTGDHVQKTVYYATEMAMKLGLNRNDVLLIEQGAMLHDLGKIGISEKILLKKGKLTKEEFEKIKEHPRIGVDIIRPIQFLHGLVPLILYHHERWDGKGYLHGLKGEEIPIGARIIALADVYQALRTDRPYRKALSEKKAIGVIRSGWGTQFDPHIVGIFLRILEAGE